METLSQSAKTVTDRMDDLMGRMDALNSRGGESRQSVSTVSDAIERAVSDADDTDKRSMAQLEEARDVSGKLAHVKEDTKNAVSGSAENIERGDNLVTAVKRAAQEIERLER